MVRTTKVIYIPTRTVPRLFVLELKLNHLRSCKVVGSAAKCLSDASDRPGGGDQYISDHEGALRTFTENELTMNSLDFAPIPAELLRFPYASLFSGY